MQTYRKHAMQLTKTSVPVVGTVSRRIDPEQTELEEDSIPCPATSDVFVSCIACLTLGIFTTEGIKI